MKKARLRIALLVVLSLVAAADTWVHAASCTPLGQGSCQACKNCRYCRHCSGNGGRCSVCR